MDLSRHNLGAAVERFKNMCQFRSADAFPMILNAKPNFFGVILGLMTRGGQTNPAFISTILEGIGNKVPQTGRHRRQIARIGRQTRSNMLLERAPLFFDFLYHILSNDCQNFSYRERDHRISCLPRSSRSKKQDAVDKVNQSTCLAGENGAVEL